MFIGLKCRDCGWGECYPHGARCSAHGASLSHRFPHFLGCTEDSIQSAVGGLDVPFFAFPAVVFPPITGAQKWAANIGNDSIKNSAANQRRMMLTGFDASGKRGTKVAQGKAAGELLSTNCGLVEASVFMNHRVVRI